MKIYEVFKPKSNSFGTDTDANNYEFDKIPPIMGMKVYYTFTDIGKYRYMVAFTDVGDKMFDLGFSAIPVEYQSNDYADYINNEPTNAHRTLKLLNILGTIMKEFDNKYNVNGFRFAGDSEKQNKLYSRMIKSPQIQDFAKENGFDYQGPKDVKVFGFGNKNYHIFTKIA